MKKNSAFMLKSGNKPSIAKLMGASPIKGFKIKPKKKPSISLVSGGMSDEAAKNLAIKGGFGPRRIPVGPRQE